MDPEMRDQTALVAISGMTCGACTSAVTSALESLEGVSEVTVSLVTERATVTFSDLNPKSLVSSIEDAGFDAQLLHLDSRASCTHIARIAIEGMTCGSCTSAVTQAVEGIEGVESVDVSLATEVAVIRYASTNSAVLGQLREAIEGAGFDARVISDALDEDQQKKSLDGELEPHSSELELKIFGHKSETELESIRSALSSVYGVRSVMANAYLDSVVVVYDPIKTGVRAFVRCVDERGCSAIVAASADNALQLAALNRIQALQGFKRDTLIAFVLGAPCIILMKLRRYMPHFLVTKVGRGIWLDDILGLLLVIPILLGPARRFYVKSFKAVKARAPTMDVLVTTSVTCAFSYSLIALIHSVSSDMEHHQMYLWDACAMILMFVLLGKYLENAARGHTSRALSQLISLVPEEALVVAKDTKESGELLATDLLQVGDIIVLRPGERVGADGIVLEGESHISESIITGESRQVRKRPGDSVIGGTINGTGALRFRVTNCGSDTKISQIIDFIKEAQETRAPIQRYADLAAAKFVPIILSLALCTLMGWLLAGWVFGRGALPEMFQHGSLFFMSLRLGIAVIVVACPCALGLATPTAVMVGTGVGAEHGILVKGGGVFEVGAHASVVLFDKTGTLTTGKMSVVRTTVAKEHWSKIRAIESNSEHPAGKAIAAYFHPEELRLDSGKPTDIAEGVYVSPGEGIHGVVSGDIIYIGRRRDQPSADIQVLVNGEPVGTIVLQDSLRADAPAVVDQLKSQGLIVGIVSGDNEQAVAAIANSLGIDPEFTWSTMKPEDKVGIIEGLKTEGNEVVFVGDGINDTPALVAASVGVSLEGSTHVAVESADIVLTQGSPIAAIPAALELCRATMKRIKINLFASVIYNVVMIPFAMGLLLPFHLMLSPMMASAAMACSSVSVVLSSLLLRRWKPHSLEGDTQQRRRPWWTRLTQPAFWRSQSRYEAVPTA
nr:Hma5 [Starmerella bombicola]